MMLIGQLIALAVNYILQFGNAMLLTYVYSDLMTSSIVAVFYPKFLSGGRVSTALIK